MSNILFFVFRGSVEKYISGYKNRIIDKKDIQNVCNYINRIDVIIIY